MNHVGRLISVSSMEGGLIKYEPWGALGRLREHFMGLLDMGAPFRIPKFQVYSSLEEHWKLRGAICLWLRGS